MSKPHRRGDCPPDSVRFVSIIIDGLTFKGLEGQGFGLEMHRPLSEQAFEQAFSAMLARADFDQELSFDNLPVRVLVAVVQVCVFSQPVDRRGDK